MRRTLLTIGLSALAVGGAATLSGSTVGGFVGTTTAATGVLLTVAALYLMAGMAIRQRIWRRLGAPGHSETQESRVASRRVF